MTKTNLSPIVAGVMNWGEWGARLSAEAMHELVEGCLSLGVTTFDHADIYGHYTTEAAFGEALRGKSALRQQLQLVTKCGIKLVTPHRPTHGLKSYDTSAAHLTGSVEQSLRNLRTDYLDVLLIHRPSPLMDFAEIAATFEALQAAGKVRQFGVSNFNTGQFEALNALFPLVTNQVEASLLHVAPFFEGTFEQCLRHGIAPMLWSPLGGGRLFAEATDEHSQKIRATVAQLAEKYSISIDTLLFAWLLKHPSKPHPVTGTTRLERIAQAVAALEVELETEDWFALLEVSRGREVA
jgi:predicted oxidoreductase